jgi:phage terminase small subunit
MNARQKRFVDEYLVDLNQTGAAERAGYSKRTAYSSAGRLMQLPEIKEAIEKRMLARAIRTNITQDRVLEELAVIGFSSVWDYEIDKNGDVTLKAGVRPEAIRAVSSIKRKMRTIPREDGDDIIEVETEIRLWDKPGTLKMCGQHLGMFQEKEPFLNPLDVARAVREAVRSMNAVDGLDDAA